MEIEFKRETFEKFMNCDLLANVGTNTNTNYNFDFEMITDRELFVESLISTKWINFKNSHFYDTYAHLRFRIGDKTPPNIQAAITKVFGPDILKKALATTEDKGFIEKVAYHIRGDIYKLMTYEQFSESSHSDYYENAVEVYLSGHIPCGWVGTKKNGKILIY